jgi:hypothetical protein
MITPKVDPYQPCPCGSGRKYKFCCRLKEVAASNEHPLALIKKSVQYPIYQCVVNEGWQELGLANIFIFRQQPNLKFICGVYLVDVFCLGVKDTFCNANIPYSGIQTMLDLADMPLVPIDYEDARSIIFGGIEFARKHGFSPNQDWKDSMHVVEPEKLFSNKFTFGRHDKPFYIPGPGDSPNGNPSS